MAIYQLEDRIPKIGENNFIADSAEIIGDVVIGNSCYIGHGARIRGDYGSIKIGDYSIVEDNCVIHARPEDKCTIGAHVTIGHGAIIHNATILDWAMIGMGAIVSDYAKVGEWGVVGEGAVVRNKQEIPGDKVAVGVPAQVIADVKEDYKKLWTRYKNLYLELGQRNITGLKKID
jgi:carbonic anhydrase/acetyltransferase-like protein (isoleucine patch superfamily)